MTAIARRRTRRTLIGVAMALVLVAMASTMFAVGFVTLSNSQEGEAVGIDDRPRVQFPVTPNALLAVTDESGRLASLVVLTLLPSGQGGSVVTVPVTADVTAGFGPERRSVSSAFETVEFADFVPLVEEMLSITVQRSESVDAAGLEAMLPAVDALRLVIPSDVIDTQGGGGVISTSGPQRFTVGELTDILAAIDDEAEVDVSHPNDVAVWEALALTAPVVVPAEPVPVDDLGRPVEPTTVGELMTRLWQGEVTVRDLLVLPVADSENPTQVDVVSIDRRDSTLVFAQISPGLVSTPNLGLKARIVANFTDEELAASEGLYESTSDLAFELIGRLLFLSANVVSVDTAPTGVPAVTIIEVADERQLDAIVAEISALLGEVDARVAEIVLEGVDVQITLGMSYLEHELARGPASVPGDNPSDTSIAESTVPVEPPVATDVPSSTDNPGTVAADG